MRVVAIRPDGPAANQGIRPGDILVGMHLWETISEDNILYIFNHAEFDAFQPVKFYILRGGETLYGHMRLKRSPVVQVSERINRN
jgi:serine protease Do